LVVQGDLRAVRPSYPLVAANVLFQILLGLAPLLSARVTPGGRLILSGMLTEELSPAEAVFGRLGMVATRIRSEGEWGALLLVRAPVAPGQAG
jgi:ribosomal protein L11 methyltransferase